VLEEMRNAVLRLALGARAGVERYERRQRARPRDRDPVDREAVRGRCRGDRRQTRNAIAKGSRRGTAER
jgi:hypothetical protein